MLGLWVHECQRVFSDKMITLEDKAWVDGAIKELCKTNFAPDLTKQVHFACMLPSILDIDRCVVMLCCLCFLPGHACLCLCNAPPCCYRQLQQPLVQPESRADQ